MLTPLHVKLSSVRGFSNFYDRDAINTYSENPFTTNLDNIYAFGIHNVLENVHACKSTNCEIKSSL